MVNFFHPCCSPLYHSVITITTRKDGHDINNLPCSSICFQPLLRLPLSHNQMASPNGNHEDKDNKGNINIPSTTSAIECKMLEYMATLTQTLQAMTQTMVNIHQYIIEKASHIKNPNLVLGGNVRFNLFHRHWTKKSYQSCKLKSYKDRSRPARHPLITQR
jgi:hypothetical protein